MYGAMRRMRLMMPRPLTGTRVSRVPPEIPWAEIIGMRHVLVHDYFGVDTEVVWGVVERDLPDLKRKIQRLLAALES